MPSEYRHYLFTAHNPFASEKTLSTNAIDLPIMTKSSTLPTRPLPADIWGAVIAKGDWSVDDLKTLRFVNAFFNEWASCLLFDRAYFSITSQNLQDFRALCSSGLSKNVQTLYLDGALFSKRSPSQYAIAAAKYFNHVLRSRRDKTGRYYPGILSHQTTNSPLSESNLNTLLSSPDAVPSGCLPGALKTAFVEGFEKWCADEELQEAYYNSGHAIGDLCALIASTKKLSRVELYPLWPEWHRKALRHELCKELSQPELDLTDALEPLIKMSKETTMRPTRSSIIVPGRSARTMHPLHLHPECFTVHDTEDRPQELHLIHSLLLALHRSKAKIEYLLLPAGMDTAFATKPRYRFEALTISIYGLIALPRRYTLDNVNPLKSVFQCLKSLELSLNLMHRNTLDRTEYRIMEGWFTEALRGMTRVERLRIAFFRPLKSYYELYKLLLDQRVKENQYTCHIDETKVDAESLDEDTVWQPKRELPGFAKAIIESIYHPVRPLEPNPWPKIRHLTLYGVQATKEDMASLFLTIAPSLKELVLEQVSLGECPCRLGRRTSWNNAWIEGDPSIAWYDTLTMLSKALKLEKCTLRLPRSQGVRLEAKLERMLGLREGSLSTHNEGRTPLVAQYVKNGGGDSLAIYYLKHALICGGCFIDEDCRLKWDKWGLLFKHAEDVALNKASSESAIPGHF